MDHPAFVRVEYWSPLLEDWAVGHAGISLMNPTAYVDKLAAKGTIARAIEVDTGEIFYGAGADLL